MRKKKENIPMEETQEAILATLPEEESTIPMFDEETQPEAQAQVEEETPTEEALQPKHKAGRKRLDGTNGEIRSEKFTVYFTPTQAEALKALCLIDGVSSVADKINTLVNAELESNRDTINGFFALRERRK